MSHTFPYHDHCGSLRKQDTHTLDELAANNSRTTV